MEERKFYVYEFIRLDNGEPFYVGKGCGNRVNDIHRGRSPWFKNVVKRHGSVSRIIVDGLTEKEAYEAEVWFIYEYKHIYNFNLVNLDDGGQGAVCGERNPMYGRLGKLNPNTGTKATEKRRKLISEALRGKAKSKTHRNKLSIFAKTRTGEKNPNYKNGEKIAGMKNPSAIKVTVYNKSKEVEFAGCKSEVCERYQISLYLLTKLKNKIVNIETDFSRENEKFKHIDGYKFEM